MEKIRMDDEREKSLTEIPNPPYLNFHSRLFSARASPLSEGCNSTSSSPNGWFRPSDDRLPCSIANVDDYVPLLSTEPTPSDKLVDEYNLRLCENFSRMQIADEQDGGLKMKRFETGPHGYGSGHGSFPRTMPRAIYDHFEGINSEASVGESFNARNLAFLGLPQGQNKGSCLTRIHPDGQHYGPSFQREMISMSGKRTEHEDEYHIPPNHGIQYTNIALLHSDYPGIASTAGHGVLGTSNCRRVINPDMILDSDFPSRASPMSTGEDCLILQGGRILDVFDRDCCSFKDFKKSSRDRGSGLAHRSPEGGIFGRNFCFNGDRQLGRPVTPGCLTEFRGSVYSMAKDQNGCRYLQRILDEGSDQENQILFNEIKNHAVELMTNPFGNYLMQKLLDVCSEEQRMQIVLILTREPGELVRISSNIYGTRVIQKLVETIRSGRQMSLVKLALEPGFLQLIGDPNGSHVILRCLKCLRNEDIEFIFDAAARFCVDIATHRHGCCVLQECVTHSTGGIREKLTSEISRNGLFLAQDPFGNYVVQRVVELDIPSSSGELISQFRGNIVRLSTQKCSSYVIQKCLKHIEESRPMIVHELLSVLDFGQLVFDPYSNYVIQSALTYTKGSLRASLVEAIRPHSIFSSSPYCKKIFARNLKK